MGQRVVVWRHGRTRWNVERRFQGQTDVPLDDTGHAQAHRAAALLATLTPTAVVSSDLRRAADTAAALAHLTCLEVTYDPALRERHGGRWQGLTASELATGFAADYTRWRAGEDVRPEGGETQVDVAARAVPAVQKAVAALPANGTLVVVTHGATARSVLGAMLGLPAGCWFALGALSNCSWSVLSRAGERWRLAEHNAGTLPEPVLSDDR